MKWSSEATNGITLSRANNMLQYDQAMACYSSVEEQSKVGQGNAQR